MQCIRDLNDVHVLEIKCPEYPSLTIHKQPMLQAHGRKRLLESAVWSICRVNISNIISISSRFSFLFFVFASFTFVQSSYCFHFIVLWLYGVNCVNILTVMLNSVDAECHLLSVRGMDKWRSCKGKFGYSQGKVGVHISENSLHLFCSERTLCTQPKKHSFPPGRRANFVWCILCRIPFHHGYDVISIYLT
jgi:hypothetical protein